MRFVIIVACIIALQACSVGRVKPEALKPKNGAAELPLDATIMIYIPREDKEERILLHHGYGNRYLHEPGKDLSEAALLMANLYFNNVNAMDLDKKTHYVLKLEGNSELNPVWASYSGEITGALYDSSGKLVYSSAATESLVAAIGTDKNAFFNVYAQATKKFFDAMFSTMSAKIVSYTEHTPAKLFSSQDESLELISTGSGFFVNNQGQVITNKHVVSQCLGISISVDGKEKPASILYSDEYADVAILDTGLTETDFVELLPSNGKVRLGEDIIAVGFPLRGELSSDPSLTTGNISSLSGLGDDKKIVQISAPIQPGNSGGPLIDKNGYLVGVVQSKLNALRLAQYTGDIAQNVNFAINTSTLIQVLDKSGYTYTRANSGKSPNLSTPDIGEKAVKYTVQVMCHG